MLLGNPATETEKREFRRMVDLLKIPRPTVTNWADVPIVFVTRPACPKCGCPGYISIRSMPMESDGSKTLRCVCKRCSGRYLIVTEPAGEEDFSGLLPCRGKVNLEQR